MNGNAQYNRAMVFAGASPHNIASTSIDTIEDGALVRRWVGTVFDMPVATDHGLAFAKRSEATHNALRFVSQCKRIVSQKR